MRNPLRYSWPSIQILTAFETYLLLLLLLLGGIEHPPLGECDRFVQHRDIADVIGKDEHQRRIEIRALLVAQAAMRLDDGAKRIVGLCKIRTGRQRQKNLR